MYLSTTEDFRSFSDVPLWIDMPNGLGGNSVKLTQPNKNGGEAVEGQAAFWWQGSMTPANTTHFLTSTLARVSGFHSVYAEATAHTKYNLHKKGAI